MPVRIPFYEQQLTPQGRLEGYARGIQYSGAVGQAMEQAGNVMMRVGEQIDREVSEGQAREADNLASAEIRTLLYDPEKGYFAQVGKGAIEGYASTEQQIKAVQDKYSQNLSPRAKEMYSATVTSRIQGALQSVSTHVMNQSRVYNTSQAEARRDGAVLDAISIAGSDPEQFTKMKNTAVLEAQFGKDAATAQMAVAATLTTLHRGVIDRLMSMPGGAQQARDWYAANFNEISPDVRDDILKALNDVDVRDQSLALSFELQSVGGLQEQEAKLKSMYQAGSINAKVYDATQDRLRQEAQIRETQQAINKNALLGLGQDWVMRNPEKSLLDMPPELYAQMVSMGKIGTLTNLKKNMQGDKDAQYDVDSYLTLRRLAAENPQKFVKEWNQLGFQFRETLKPSHWEKLTEINSDIVNNNRKGMDAVKIVDERMSKIDDTLRAAGLKLSKTEEGYDAQRISNFRASYIEATDDFLRNNERMPTNKEAEQLAYDLIQKLKIPGRFYGTNEVLFFEATSEQMQKLKSSEQFLAIEQKLERANRSILESSGIRFTANGKPIKDAKWDDVVIKAIEAEAKKEFD